MPRRAAPPVLPDPLLPGSSSQGALEGICISGSPAASEADVCPEGQRPLFTAHMIHETHLLLFETALMHIVVTCSTFYLTLARVRGS